MTENNFFGMVYEVVKLIPYGRVTSYGAIAAYLGAKSSSRMVGWALNASHGPFSDIPAHRVVNRNGILSGKAHFGGENMKSLLEAEGIEVIDDKIQNFKQLFWDPSELDKDVSKA
ncbi:MAG: MGMT family protein [Bacteroidetes bacterium]|nr:MGMT family protein [Bacteroidota bacterium]